ncbi:hypothetical protein SNE40_019076 [Patella caerulea]|uniref:Uncharacterized protein n=1 Tax=Patella caerulea TaxID=87958 RepID=A0AAN8J985_PATCE
MAEGNLYHHGVWLTQNSGGKTERYEKWSAVRKDKRLESLEKEEHDCLVKMNVKKLELQAELDKMEKSKRRKEFRRSATSSPSEKSSPIGGRKDSKTLAIKK